MVKFILPSLPDQVRGSWKIDRTIVTQEDADWSNMRARVRGNRHLIVKPGEYVRLMRGNTVVMSDTSMERSSHWQPLHLATGRVLINGLGLGMIAQSIAAKPDVSSVEVIELDADVIAMVKPQLDPKITVYHASAFDWQPPKGARWNLVWHDIWDTICSDNLPEMIALHRKYGRRCDWQGSWMRDMCEEGRRRYG